MMLTLLSLPQPSPLPRRQVSPALHASHPRCQHLHFSLSSRPKCPFPSPKKTLPFSLPLPSTSATSSVPLVMCRSSTLRQHACLHLSLFSRLNCPYAPPPSPPLSNPLPPTCLKILFRVAYQSRAFPPSPPLSAPSHLRV